MNKVLSDEIVRRRMPHQRKQNRDYSNCLICLVLRKPYSRSVARSYTRSNRHILLYYYIESTEMGLSEQSSTCIVEQWSTLYTSMIYTPLYLIEIRLPTILGCLEQTVSYYTYHSFLWIGSTTKSKRSLLSVQALATPSLNVSIYHSRIFFR